MFIRLYLLLFSKGGRCILHVFISQHQSSTVVCPMQNKSQENWLVGNRCLRDGNMNAAASRLYYAVFQAILSWARATQKYHKTDSSVHADMYRYVRAHGKQRVHFSFVFQEIRALRETADYQSDPIASTDINELLNDCDKICHHYLKNAQVNVI